MIAPVYATCQTCRQRFPYTQGMSHVCAKPRAVAPVAAVKGKRDGSHAEEALYAALRLIPGATDMGPVGDSWPHYTETRLAFVRGYPWGLYLTPRRRFQADAAFPSMRLLIEVDGIAHKIGSRQKGDVLKSQLADAAGWKVLRILPEQVHNGEAVALVAKALNHAPVGGKEE